VENLLPYGAMVFNAFGPRNAHFEAVMAEAAKVVPWINAQCAREALSPEELVRSAPDILLVHGTPAPAKTHTTIPIVFTAVSDPIGQGFVASISHPGGNVTGFSNFEPNICRHSL
jgi:ABC transporter substrate binding protein